MLVRSNLSTSTMRGGPSLLVTSMATKFNLIDQHSRRRAASSMASSRHWAWSYLPQWTGLCTRWTVSRVSKQSEVPLGRGREGRRRASASRVSSMIVCLKWHLTDWSIPSWSSPRGSASLRSRNCTPRPPSTARLCQRPNRARLTAVRTSAASRPRLRTCRSWPSLNGLGGRRVMRSVSEKG